MLRRIPQSIWLRTFLIAALLGIWLGIGLAQGQWIFFGAVLGWYVLPVDLFALLTHPSAGDSVFWLQGLVALGYVLGVFGYSVCAYWTIRSTHSRRNGLTVTVVAAFVSTLASIPSAAIMAASINQHENFSMSTLFAYATEFWSYVFVLMNLFISAILGWLIALSLTRRGRGDNSLGEAQSSTQ